MGQGKTVAVVSASTFALETRTKVSHDKDVVSGDAWTMTSRNILVSDKLLANGPRLCLAPLHFRTGFDDRCGRCSKNRSHGVRRRDGNSGWNSTSTSFGTLWMNGESSRSSSMSAPLRSLSAPLRRLSIPGSSVAVEGMVASPNGRSPSPSVASPACAAAATADAGPSFAGYSGE